MKERVKSLFQKDIFNAGEIEGNDWLGWLIREKGKETRCGKSVIPEEIIEYGAWRKLHGYLILQPNTKKTPSPG